MKQLIFESIYLVFGEHYVQLALISGITYLVAIIALLSILNNWGRS